MRSKLRNTTGVAAGWQEPLLECLEELAGHHAAASTAIEGLLSRLGRRLSAFLSRPDVDRYLSLLSPGDSVAINPTVWSLIDVTNILACESKEEIFIERPGRPFLTTRVQDDRYLDLLFQAAELQFEPIVDRFQLEAHATAYVLSLHEYIILRALYVHIAPNDGALSINEIGVGDS
jgi:hypothetical protein